MTCIAAIREGGDVYLGGDSAATDGYDLVLIADEKVFAVGPYVIGFCGSTRIGQLLRYSLSPPQPKTKDLQRFMATSFVDSVRKCLKDGGAVEIDKGVETGGQFLVGVKGRLFFVDPDFQVCEPETPYYAIGCGGQIANGALYAQPKTMSPKSRILQALAAAEKFSAGVRAPFRVVSTKS